MKISLTYQGNGASNNPLENLNQTPYSIASVKVLSQMNGPTRLQFGSSMYSKYSLLVITAEKAQMATLNFKMSESAGIHNTYFMKKFIESTDNTNQT